jgi:hypothetical protein
MAAAAQATYRDAKKTIILSHWNAGFRIIYFQFSEFLIERKLSSCWNRKTLKLWRWCHQVNKCHCSSCIT